MSIFDGIEQQVPRRHSRVSVYHGGVDIRWALQQPGEVLGRMLTRGGVSLNADTCREYLIQQLREGKDTLCFCDRVDERGNCMGHEEPAAGHD